MSIDPASLAEAFKSMAPKVAVGGAGAAGMKMLDKIIKKINEDDGLEVDKIDYDCIAKLDAKVQETALKLEHYTNRYEFTVKKGHKIVQSVLVLTGFLSFLAFLQLFVR